MVFHSALFPAMRHTVQPVGDILHLLQCLLTGMLVLVKEDNVPGEGLWKTIRALPPPEWLTNNEMALVEGELIEQIEQLDEGWWQGVGAGGAKSVLFPGMSISLSFDPTIELILEQLTMSKSSRASMRLRSPRARLRRRRRLRLPRRR